MSPEFVSAGELAAMVPDGATIAVTGSGGGCLEADAIYAALERRFLTTGSPASLTLIFSLGAGDRGERGISRFAHEGMVRRVIGGHWSWSPQMQRLAAEEKIEAYSLPAGAISLTLRESGAGRPGLITRTGLGTFVDPERGGGRVNARAKEALVERIEIAGEIYLRYKPFKVDFGIIKGTCIDEAGNLSNVEEPSDLDAYAVALAATNTGGRVLAQVREVAPPHTMRPREVTVPGSLVHHVVVVPDQLQTHHGGYDLSLAGLSTPVVVPQPPDTGTGTRRVIALRAAQELRPGQSINFGFGVSSDVATIIGERGEGHLYRATIEQGLHGGMMLTGMRFGMAMGAAAIKSSSDQFDYYHGGGIDTAFLGMAEMDGAGNVNVSHVGPDFVGPGGFIDISQNAAKVVFCGTFETRGSEIEVVEGGLRIRAPGAIAKLVTSVGSITFSGERARATGQEVIYVTERAVFRLVADGIEMIEIAPGVDMKSDVLERMGFQPLVRDVRPMPAEVFIP